MITAVDAARLILADYDGDLTAEGRLDMNHTQAAIVNLPGQPLVLLIRGTDELFDWIRNFNWTPDMTPGDGMYFWWHRGFLAHTRPIYSWVRDKPVELVIGHSLGGACTQIVATSLNLPGIAFSTPLPLWSPFDLGRVPPNGHLIEIHNRSDDYICKVPPEGAGFRNVNEATWYKPDAPNPGEDHRIKHLLPLLEAAAAAAQAP